MKLTDCIGCGAGFDAGDGPTHPYMESSPGCWAAFGEVLAREYGDANYFRVHRLTVDAYAVQHPGRPSKQSIQSVALHLISLHAIFEKSYDPGHATKLIQAAAKDKSRFEWLEPPASRGAVTVADVRRAASADDHARLVREWAAGAWSAWSPHHIEVRSRAQAVAPPGRHRGA